MINQGLQSLDKFRRSGFWLAVVSQRNTLGVAAAGKTISSALEKAKKLGWKDPAIIKSSEEYALLAPVNL